MKYLKSYNETVWTRNGSPVNDVTGSRKKMSEIVIDKLTELGLYNNVTFKYQWNEPPKSYGLPYEMSRQRICLTLFNYNGVPFDDIESKLTELFKYLVTQNIYTLRCIMEVKRQNDNKIFKSSLSFDRYGNYYFSNIFDEDLNDSIIKNMYITLQHNEGNVSDEYIEKYNSFFK